MARLKIGCQLPQDVNDFDRLIEIARDCEKLGYDSVWAYDHLSPFWSPKAQAMECWTTLSAIAARTNRIRLGTLVTNVTLRSPSLLAKMSSTLDNISHGRLILGLGTGDKLSRKELESYGYDFLSLNERVERLRETILILKAMWTQNAATFQGKHFRLNDAVNFPKPMQKPHPPIWVGGKHAKILSVIAELADGWNYWGLDKKKFKTKNDFLSTKCADYGRKPSSIVKSWLGNYNEVLKGTTMSRRHLDLMANLRELVDVGPRYLIISFDAATKTETYQAFAEAVKSLD